MPIYKRCLSCTTDKKQNARKCSCELTLVDPANFKYKIKLKRNGKWKSKILPAGTSLADAKKAEAELLADTYRQTDEQPKVSEKLSVDFDVYYAAAKLIKDSHEDDLRRWNTFVKGRDYLTTQGILSILSTMRDKEYAPATIKHVLQVINRVHNWHIDTGIHPTGINPCKTIKLPKFDNKITNPLSEDETRGMLAYLESREGNRQAALFTCLAVYTGRRQGELLALLKEDVDLERGTITCKNTKNGKTLSFPINQAATRCFQEALDLNPKGEKVFSYTRCGFKSTWYRLRDRMLERGVITKPIRFHDLRHTYASILANSGKVSLQTIQKLLGHSTIELTQRYAHLNDKTLRDAVDLLEAVA